MAPGGSNAETYESVLVEVSNVTVDASPNMYGETLLKSGLRIGNTLYDYTQDFSPSYAFRSTRRINSTTVRLQVGPPPGGADASLQFASYVCPRLCLRRRA